MNFLICWRLRLSFQHIEFLLFLPSSADHVAALNNSRAGYDHEREVKAMKNETLAWEAKVKAAEEIVVSVEESAKSVEETTAKERKENNELITDVTRQKADLVKLSIKCAHSILNECLECLASPYADRVLAMGDFTP